VNARPSVSWDTRPELPRPDIQISMSFSDDKIPPSPIVPERIVMQVTVGPIPYRPHRHGPQPRDDTEIATMTIKVL
jgi:hypothetical protein